MSDAGRTKGLRLQHQLTLCSLLPVALLGAVATLVSIYALRQISLTLILQRNTALVRVAANGLANDLNGYLCPLQTVAEVLSFVYRIDQRAEKVTERRNFMAGAA